MCKSGPQINIEDLCRGRIQILMLRNCNCSCLLSWGWNFTAKRQYLETVAVTSCCSKLRKFAVKLCNKNCKPLQSLFVSTRLDFLCKISKYLCCDFLFNVLSNCLTVLLLRVLSHRVAKVDGAVVFYKAFSGSTVGPESGLAKRKEI